jgi:hypothetical protein
MMGQEKGALLTQEISWAGLTVYIVYIVNILNNKKSLKTLKVQSEFVKEGQKIQGSKEKG